MLQRISLCFAFSLLLFVERASADFIDTVVFISASFNYDDGRPPKNVGTGTGFVISKDGFVVTAKHVIPKEVPAGATLVLTGSLRTRDNPRKLFFAETIPLGVDITLLRFDPNAQTSWEYLKISPRKISDINFNDVVVGWGFPLDQGLNAADLKVKARLGTDNTITVGGGLVRGMSGGPVLDAANNVVGVITGGAQNEPNLGFFTPISFANPLIRDIAEYADDRSAAVTPPAKGSAVPATGPIATATRAPIAKNYDIQETRSIGSLKNKDFSITREAEAGRTITQARFVITMVSGVSDISVSVADDKKSVLLKYVVSGGQNGSGFLAGTILTEQQ